MSLVDRHTATSAELDALFGTASARRESGRHVRQRPASRRAYLAGYALGLVLAVLVGAAAYLATVAVLRPSPADAPPPVVQHDDVIAS